MRESSQKKPEKIITDLKDFDSNEKSLFLSASAKNLDTLKTLSIENLWLVGANDIELRKILSFISLKYLNLYQVLAKDLSILEIQENLETLILEWSTKASSLWDISKNTNLRTLEILDFSKLESVDQLSSATQLKSLVFGGGHGKPIKIETLKPLESLNGLESLGLINLKVLDGSLEPLGNLKTLKNLNISNQFETKEYAWLATRLQNTQCKLFEAVNTCKITGTDNEIVWDTMVTGKRKPFLLSTIDHKRIEKYIKDFERLKSEQAK